jgi:2-methylisocitrate lyase-like PEP mutase family enzyme
VLSRLSTQAVAEPVPVPVPVRQLSWEPVFVVQGLAQLGLRLVRVGSAAAWAQRLLA